MAHRIQEPKVERPELSVLPRGTAMVPDYPALVEAHVRRFVGWVHDPNLGDAGGFAKQLDAPVKVPSDSPYMAEYVRHVKDGDLWAANPETAAACGVPFEPDFLDEHPKTSKVHEKLIADRKVSADKETATAKRAEADAAKQKAAPPADGTRVPSGDKSTESKQ